MKKIAIPTANGKLSPHFGGSEFFTVFTVENNEIISEELLPTPEHTTGSYPHFLGQQQITDIIVGGIGGKAVEIFNQYGIDVYAGADVLEPRKVVDLFLQGKLTLTGNSCHHEGEGPESHEHGHHHHH